MLLTHLLKWLLQPNRRSSGWEGSITEQRRQIRLLQSRYPSLRARLPQIIAATYSRAKVAAAAETGLSLRRFPEKCPFSVTEVVDPDFFPE